jgi:hypothetical protein
MRVSSNGAGPADGLVSSKQYAQQESGTTERRGRTGRDEQPIRRISQPPCTTSMVKESGQLCERTASVVLRDNEQCNGRACGEAGRSGGNDVWMLGYVGVDVHENDCM